MGLNVIKAERLAAFSPISLEEMKEVRLMNRIDTKYVTSFDRLMQIMPYLEDSYRLQEIGGKRIGNYHTIYYDTEQKDMYLTHHNGRKTRLKIRVREYVDSSIWFLEIKNKNNKGRTKKERIPVKDDNIHTVEEAERFLDDKSWYALKEVSAKLENNFQRLTFVNDMMTERLTVDFNICFRNLETECHRIMSDLVVIELKQDGNVHSPFKDLLSDFAITRSSFSKYCIGLAVTDSYLKKNRFKKTCMYINKITNNNHKI